MRVPLPGKTSVSLADDSILFSASEIGYTKIIHVPFIKEFYYTARYIYIYLYENSCTSKASGGRGKNWLELEGTKRLAGRVSNRIEWNRDWRSSSGVVGSKEFFSPLPPRFHYPVGRRNVE